MNAVSSSDIPIFYCWRTATSNICGLPFFVNHIMYHTITVCLWSENGAKSSVVSTLSTLLKSLSTLLNWTGYPVIFSAECVHIQSLYDCLSTDCLSFYWQIDCSVVHRYHATTVWIDIFSIPSTIYSHTVWFGFCCQRLYKKRRKRHISTLVTVWVLLPVLQWSMLYASMRTPYCGHRLTTFAGVNVWGISVLTSIRSTYCMSDSSH